MKLENITIKKEKNLEVAKRIRERMDELNIGQKDILNKFSFDVSQGAVAKWISLNPQINNGISIEALEEFSNILDTTTDFLLYGRKENNLSLKAVPLIGKSSCGKPKNYELDEYEQVSISSDYYKDGMYAVEAEGDSMSPKINDGDIVYCLPNRQIENGTIVHYSLNGESGIKRYKINEKGTIISLIPINQNYDIITIHCDDIFELSMAKVVARFDKDF